MVYTTDSAVSIIYIAITMKSDYQFNKKYIGAQWGRGVCVRKLNAYFAK